MHKQAMSMFFCSRPCFFWNRWIDHMNANASDQAMSEIPLQTGMHAEAQHLYMYYFLVQLDYKMGQEAIAKIFFEHPSEAFHIRGIARLLRISKTAVSHHIHLLLKKGIIRSEKEVFVRYRANTQDQRYHDAKLLYALQQVLQSGTIASIEEQVHPTSIVLFGSYAKAEFDAKSDIDLFVQAHETTVDVRAAERKLGKTINLLFAPDTTKLAPELLGNIVNGITLSGFLRLR